MYCGACGRELVHSVWLDYASLQEKCCLQVFSKAESFLTIRFGALFGVFYTSTDLQVFNAQTCVDHLTLKGVWPTSPRDFLSTVHWRLVGPNALALVAVACPASALSPEVRRAYPLCESAAAEAAGCVRGELIMAGWRLKEVS